MPTCDMFCFWHNIWKTTKEDIATGEDIFFTITYFPIEKVVHRLL